MVLSALSPIPKFPIWRVSYLVQYVKRHMSLFIRRRGADDLRAFRGLRSKTPPQSLRMPSQHKVLSWSFVPSLDLWRAYARRFSMKPLNTGD